MEACLVIGSEGMLCVFGNIEARRFPSAEASGMVEGVVRRGSGPGGGESCQVVLLALWTKDTSVISVHSMQSSWGILVPIVLT